MNVNNDNFNQLEINIEKTDSYTASNILNLLAMNEHSVWFNNDMPSFINKEDDLAEPEQNLLTFEQVKELYPQWFKQ